MQRTSSFECESKATTNGSHCTTRQRRVSLPGTTTPAPPKLACRRGSLSEVVLTADLARELRGAYSKLFDPRGSCSDPSVPPNSPSAETLELYATLDFDISSITEAFSLESTERHEYYVCSPRIPRVKPVIS
jgi:hypothetical protein